MARIQKWKKLGKGYWVHKSGRGYSEIRIVNSYSTKSSSKYLVMYKMKGSYWAVLTRTHTYADALREARRFMRRVGE